MSQIADCPVCRSPVSSPGRFCAQCGATLGASGTVELSTRHPAADPDGLPEALPTAPRPRIHAVHRQPLGLRPGVFLTGLSAGALLAAVILFALGAWAVGIVAVLLAVIGALLLAAAVRDEPTAPEARLSRRVLVQAGGAIRLGSAIARTSLRTGISLVRLGYRRRRLQSLLRAQLSPLGEATYRGETARVQELKAQAERIEQAIEQTDRQTAALRQSARRHLDGERATIQRTQALPVQPPAN
jgi:hypothetical protein